MFKSIMSLILEVPIIAALSIPAGAEFGTAKA